MKLIKRRARPHAQVSIILVDWSVRESFHLLHYLSKQTVSRDLFEIIVVEFYSRRSKAVQKFEDQVDTWLLLEMPDSCYYHKHLLYNAGIVVSGGDLVTIVDSDAIVGEGFIDSLLQQFSENERIVLHLDQFRNSSRRFYPFSYPTVSKVLGPGCINNAGGVTTGLRDYEDSLHTRNYGACMCARRDDLISIGGADEHPDFLGHICGPYDMTFRLCNVGCREVWHEQEFVYHTWHPGQDGVANFLGPHDGRQMSTTALEAIVSGRVLPLVENQVLRDLRIGKSIARGALPSTLIDSAYSHAWGRVSSTTLPASSLLESGKKCTAIFGGARLYREGDTVTASWIIGQPPGRRGDGDKLEQLSCTTESEAKKMIRRCLPLWLRAAGAVEPSDHGYSQKILEWLRRFRVVLSEMIRRTLSRAIVVLHWIVERSVPVLQAVSTLRQNIPGTTVVVHAWAEQRGAVAFVILAGGRPELWSLRILMLLRLLRRGDVRKVSDGKELQSILEQVASEEEIAAIFVPAQLLLRYHGVISGSPVYDRVLMT